MIMKLMCRISPSLELYRDIKNKVKDVRLHDSNVIFKDYDELKDIKTFSFPKEISIFDHNYCYNT